MADKFRATFYVATYELARDGMSDEQIAKALGVVGQTFRRWCARRPALRDALERARNPATDDRPTFHQYVYDHLPPHLRELWDKINECEELENGIERIEALLADKGKRARQHLFLYALTQSMFNVSAALRKLGLSRRTFDAWTKSDPEFAELMDEIHWYKENFFEQAFIGRVAAGDTAAIIHAAKTQLRGRGYNDKVEVVHSGSITTEAVVNIAELDLDVETRRKVLTALRKKFAADSKAGITIVGGIQ